MRVRRRLARVLRRLTGFLHRLARRLDPELHPQSIEWSDGRKLKLSPDWTLEQALDLMARVDEFIPSSLDRKEPRP